MRLVSLLCASLGALLLVTPALAQGTGTLTGRVVDAATGETMPGANVRIDGTTLGAATNADGQYRIIGVPVGTYSATASFVGYPPVTTAGVVIENGRTRQLHFELRAGEHLGELVVEQYRTPLIQNDAIGAARVVSADDTRPRRTRRSSPAAAPQGGVASPPAPVDLHLRGGRAEDVAYYVDGVRVSGSAAGAPQQAIQEQGTLLGTVPSRYGDAPAGAAGRPSDSRQGDREQYAPIEETPFRRPTDTPLSTFGVDVDRASYANVRRMLVGGALPPADAVRLEEFVNAFDYGIASPRATDDHPVRVESELAACPWAPAHRLLRVSLQARRVAFDELPPVNLVFLLDVSGSMASADKLPLVQDAMRLLVGALRPQDRVALVVYAGAAGLVLPPTAGRDRRQILDALDRLQAGGSTAGGQGLRLAYATARQHYDPAAVNRVILATDGDFNVGVSSDAEMLRLVEEERQSGVLLSVLGVGSGNLQDAKMELLANRGNGTYSYLDSVREAERVLVREAGATLVALAKDVKVQVEFNPAVVAGYRLLGYENRALAAEDFADDRRDAGEMGAGHAVTALYELIPVGAAAVAAEASPATDPGSVEPLRYQQTTLSADARAGEWATVRIRYKPSAGGGEFADESVRLEAAVAGAAVALDQAGEPTRWAAAVAEAALVLRQSAHAPGASLDHALAVAQSARGADPNGDRAEFIRLVETARTLMRVRHAQATTPVALGGD